MSKNKWIITAVLLLVACSVVHRARADNAADLDAHSNVREAIALADASSGICVEVNASGQLEMAIPVAGDPTSYLDDDDWTDASSAHKLVGGLYQSSPQSITDGDVGPLQVNANGYLMIQDTGASNLTAISTDTAALVVDAAAIEALAITIDADTSTINTSTATCATDLNAISVDTAALVVDAAAIEALAITIDADTSTINTSTASTATYLTGISIDTAATNVSTTATALHLTGISIDTAATNVSTTATALYLTGISIDTTATALHLTGISVDTAATNVSTTATALHLTGISIDTAATNVSTTATALHLTGISVDMATVADNISDWDNVGSDACTVEPDAKIGLLVKDDGQVKGSAGTLYGVIACFNTVDVGDKISIRNSTDASGTILCELIAGATTDSVTFFPSVGVAFSAGIYQDALIAGTGNVSGSYIYE